MTFKPCRLYPQCMWLAKASQLAGCQFFNWIFFFFLGWRCQGDVHGLGAEQHQVRRVHSGPSGAAVWRAGREEGQVLHQAPGLQGEPVRRTSHHQNTTNITESSKHICTRQAVMCCIEKKIKRDSCVSFIWTGLDSSKHFSWALT